MDGRMGNKIILIENCFEWWKPSTERPYQKFPLDWPKAVNPRCPPLVENIKSFCSFMDYEALILPFEAEMVTKSEVSVIICFVCPCLWRSLGAHQQPCCALNNPTRPWPSWSCQLQASDQMMVKLFSGSIPASPEKYVFLFHFVSFPLTRM